MIWFGFFFLIQDCDVAYVPCSGLTGENLVAPSTGPPLKQWYSGPTLLNTIGNAEGEATGFTPLFDRVLMSQ